MFTSRIEGDFVGDAEPDKPGVPEVHSVNALKILQVVFPETVFCSGNRCRRDHIDKPASIFVN
ncbi:hypothetical protein SDC9_58146 [bioreactor metagenome]|uniref:Uncharacterized protein n=1 Tax=bioreactor metagenome TaxID=1076179 RepID=A0A644X6M7_9ZZZZ